MSRLLQDLNEAQQKVVLATHGPVLVLAGAGSGKTRALTHRVAYLIEQRIAQPEEILAVTFTNKAAAEMKQRVRSLLPHHHFPSTIGTFHALGVRILREQAGKSNGVITLRPRNFTIFDTQDSERVMRLALRERGISSREWNVGQVRHRISIWKNSLQSPAEALRSAHSARDEAVAHIFARYEELLLAQDAYDFDDLLLYPWRWLDTASDVRAHYQARWRWLSVDEYQDTNPIQERLLRLLLGAERHICVVGDDYQAIYSWRGAKVDHILRFEQDFPQCTVVYLTQNYRSTPAILEAANCIIAENIAQKHKELWTEAPEGELVRIAPQASDYSEAQWVRQQIEAHVNAGGHLRECVVLYRTNAQSRLFEEQFLTQRIPYTIVGGFRFYERREVKDVLAFLHFWVNPNSSMALARIAETLWRGVGKKTLTRWEEDAQATKRSFLEVLGQEAARRPAVRSFLQAHAGAHQQIFATVAELLTWLVKRSGYEEWLKRQADGEERWENVEELFNVASVYSDPALFLNEVALLTDIDTLAGAQDRVTCMTLHAAKGLEFSRVWLVGCEEGLLPHANSLHEQAQLEEERRLLYVGMTRARHTLTLTWAAQRYLHGRSTPQAPSRFLRALPDTACVYEETDLEPVIESDDLLDFKPQRDFTD